MRKILFRGYDEEESHWVYGDLLQYRILLPVIFDKDKVQHEVSANSVGQFTGLTDRLGKEIYEGDLLQWSDESGLASTVYYEVFYDDGNGVNSNGFKCSRTHYKGSRCGGYIPPFNHVSFEEMIVIGNIYENSDLL